MSSHDLASIHIEEPFRLQAHQFREINSRTVRADWRVPDGSRKLNLDSSFGLLASLCASFTRRQSTAANGREGEFLNDANETAKPPTYNLEHLERNLRMLHAICLEVPA